MRVVRGCELDPNTAQTPGMNRAAAITHARVGAEKLWAGTVTIHPNAKTGAHHHGALECVIYVVSGRARMRWGERLEFIAEAGPGDFIYVPPYVPHQEINAADEPLECVLVRSGQDPVVVNLDITPGRAAGVGPLGGRRPSARPAADTQTQRGSSTTPSRHWTRRVHLCFILSSASFRHGSDHHSSRRLPPLWERVASGLGALPSLRRDAAKPRRRPGDRRPRVAEASGLELDRRPRPRSAPRTEASTARVPRVEPSEAPTRELAPEPRPPADPSTRVSVGAAPVGALGVLLLAQLLVPRRASRR